MRALFAGGTKQVELAVRYEVAQGTVSDIVLRKSWDWLL